MSVMDVGMKLDMALCVRNVSDLYLWPEGRRLLAVHGMGGVWGYLCSFKFSPSIVNADKWIMRQSDYFTAHWYDLFSGLRWMLDSDPNQADILKVITDSVEHLLKAVRTDWWTSQFVQSKQPYRVSTTLSYHFFSSFFATLSLCSFVL